ncbi:hypothetical protein PP175_18345 [Aneurinibacillus sp. Ricciae_BoGa-3]|uniref:hypothetical protein n=1 Tax=Aneurinibacillus sp. Ricciae_BoGa-3 TaxID=3022697 RepID=UPI0023420FC0|nr:hypothetical protein [Aneurinibacillus sp. Ricciae_BoGa-3]WCK53285.1 hypothetical protein PP175_18035 [Aneurinibacillus sp. Ricciae_BoGa-3]WCK53324.1 hypothetical protein PP175_18345 [Aneurinibacillus sp. Ricciae_BoGa-3]
MDNYIQGKFFLASDGAATLNIHDAHMVSLSNGMAIKLLYNGEWVSGIYIDGDVIYSKGKERLRIGDNIRIKK